MLAELLRQLRNRVLRLRHSHAVAGGDHDRRGTLEKLRRLFRRDLGVLPVITLGGR